MEKTYVEQRDGGYWITGTRISLNSIVYAFKHGAAPESMQRAFPLLTLDAYLEQADPAYELQARALNAAARTAKPALFQRLEQARQACEATHQ